MSFVFSYYLRQSNLHYGLKLYLDCVLPHRFYGCTGELIFTGDTQIFNDLVEAVFSNAKTGFEISLGLTGALTLWMGLLKVGEKGGVVAILGKAMGPLFEKLFPGLPKGHPAYGSIMLNLSANMLGLDNAATPMGLKGNEGDAGIQS